MKELLESGVHFGHQTRRWNPRMKQYIFTERGGIYIIDLQKTIRLIDEAYDFAQGRGHRVANTCCSSAPRNSARTPSPKRRQRAGMPFVSHRWLGGLLTNFNTISSRIKRLHELRRLRDEGQIELLPKREQMDHAQRAEEAGDEPRRRRGHGPAAATRSSSSIRAARRS